MFLESIQSGRLIDSPRNLLSLVLFSNDHNLNLSPGTLLMLMQANDAALRDTGRIEFGAGTLDSLSLDPARRTRRKPLRTGRSVLSFEEQDGGSRSRRRSDQAHARML